MKWIEVTVRTSVEASEAVVQRLLSQGAGGAVIEDPGLLARRRLDSPLDYFDGSVTAPEEYRVIAYWPEDELFSGRLASFKTWLGQLAEFGLDAGPGEVLLQECDEEDWAGAWKRYYHAQKFGRLVVAPSWEAYDAAPGEVVLRLDPGMAFGTGNHPSTALCLRALERRIRGGERLIDVGTGSGILAIAAAKLGAGEVLAFDVDPVATRVAQENVVNNDVQHVVRTLTGDAAAVIGKEPVADVVVANIIADVIIQLAPVLSASVSGGGLVIAAGIVKTRATEVEESLRAAGLRLVGMHEDDGWVCLESTRA